MASGTPSTYNGNFASPVMMDGFWHDMPYGRGSKEHDPDLLPSATGSRTMNPTEDVLGNDDLNDEELSEEAQVFAPPPSDLVGDLGSVFGKRATGLETKLLTSEGIVDHHWLSDAVQDPHRLPDQQDMITQLQNLWGDRTDGLFRVPVREVVEEAVQAEDNAEDLIRKEETFRDLTKTAARLVASGKRLSETLRKEVGPLWVSLEPKVAHLEGERGLLGPVYLYASSYPRLYRGKWAKVFKEHLKTAKYLINDSNEDVLIEGLRDHTKVRVVASVDAIPWVKLCREVTGKRVSSPKDAKKLVQAYYQAGPMKVPTWYHDGTRPIPTMPMDLVTPLEADRKFAEYVPPPVERPSLEARMGLLAKKKAFRTLGSWVKAGLLSKDRGSKYASALVEGRPSEVLKKAASEIRSFAVGKYHGEGEGKIASSGAMSEGEILQALQEAQDVLASTWETAFASRVAKEAAKEHAKRASVIQRYVRDGRLTKDQGDGLMASPESNAKVFKKAAELLRRVASQEYSGKHKAPPRVVVAEGDIQETLTKTAQKAQEVQAKIDDRVSQGHLQQKLTFLERALQAGVVGDAFLGKVRETMTRKEASEAWVSLQPMVKKAYATVKTSSAKVFEGPRYTQHLPSTPGRVLHASEKRRVLHAVSQWMHEGLSKQALDLQIQSKVASDVQDAMAKDLGSFRETHDGLLGHLYVMASHYASPKGVTGCEAGAAKHRQDGTRYVLAMDRCGPCTLRNAADHCMKYNKDVLWEVPADARSMVRKAASKKASVSEAPVFEVAAMEIQVDALSTPKDPIEISFEGGWSW